MECLFRHINTFNIQRVQIKKSQTTIVVWFFFTSKDVAIVSLFLVSKLTAARKS
jgi:hypothetical protein